MATSPLKNSGRVPHSFTSLAGPSAIGNKKKTVEITSDKLTSAASLPSAPQISESCWKKVWRCIENFFRYLFCMGKKPEAPVPKPAEEGQKNSGVMKASAHRASPDRSDKLDFAPQDDRSDEAHWTAIGRSSSPSPAVVDLDNPPPLSKEDLAVCQEFVNATGTASIPDAVLRFRAMIEKLVHPNQKMDAIKAVVEPSLQTIVRAFLLLKSISLATLIEHVTLCLKLSEDFIRPLPRIGTGILGIKRAGTAAFSNEPQPEDFVAVKLYVVIVNICNILQKDEPHKKEEILRLRELVGPLRACVDPSSDKFCFPPLDDN